MNASEQRLVSRLATQISGRAKMAKDASAELKEDVLRVVVQMDTEQSEGA